MSGAKARPGTQSLTATKDVHDALRILRDEQVTVQLRFEGNPASFSSRLLDLNLKKRSYVLDKLNPGGGHGLMNARVKFAMSARSDGLYLYAAANVVALVEADRGLPYYHVPFPTSLLLQHRRGALRIPVSRYVDAVGQFTLPQRGLTVNGRLVDLSSGGLRVEFDGMMDPMPEAAEVMAPARISLPGGRELEFAAVARHAHYVAERDVTVCGAEFQSMAIRSRRHLQAFIDSLARQAAPAPA